MAEGEEGGGGSLKASLTKKLGPLPVWVWAIGAAGVGYYLLRRYQSSSSTATTATQQPTTASQGQPSDLQQIPVYLSSVPTTTADIPAATTATGGQTNSFTELPGTGTIETGLGAFTAAPGSAAALGLTDAQFYAQQAAFDAAQANPATAPQPSIGQFGGGRMTQTYQAVQTPGGYVYTYGPSSTPGLQGTAAYFVNPTAQWQIDSNNALNALHGTLQRPAPLNTNPGVNQPALAPGQLSTSSFGYSPGPSAGAAAALSGAGVTP